MAKPVGRKKDAGGNQPVVIFHPLIMVLEPAGHESCHAHRWLKMAFDQKIPAVDIGRHLVLVPDIHGQAFGHQGDDRAGDIERDMGTGLRYAAGLEQIAGRKRTRRHDHALAGPDGAFPAIAQPQLYGMCDPVSVRVLIPQYFGRFGPIQYPRRLCARIIGRMSKKAFRHRLFPPIGAACVAIAAIDAFAVRCCRTVIFPEPGGDRLVVHRVVRLRRIFVPAVDQMRTVVAANDRIDF